jgi:hypothetical protein
MNCPHCGSPAVQPSGTCSTCGRSTNTPDDPTALHYPPPVDPFATAAPLTGADPLAPYTQQPEPYSPPRESSPAPTYPTSAQRDPTPGRPSAYPPSGQPSAYPTPSQPSPGSSSSPTSGQPQPGQPYPGQPYPGQPYPAQPYPAQPYPAQPYPAQSHSGQPHPGQPYAQQPYPYAPQQSANQGFSITAYVLAAIAVFLVPIVFGLAAILFAAAARRRGERNAQLAMKLAVAGTLLGFFFNYVANQLF